MKTIASIQNLSEREKKMAVRSYSALAAVIKQLQAEETDIEIEETKDKIRVPLSALKLLGDVLKAMSLGKSVSFVPVATEVTTQKAADILGCSRPYFIKLLEEGKIKYTRVGKHRRVKFEEVLQYRKQMKERQKQHLTDMMHLDEATGLYDS